MASANEIHREFVAAWNARDFDKFKSMLDPEYTYTGSDGKTIPGPDAGVAAAEVFASAFSGRANRNQGNAWFRRNFHWRVPHRGDPDGADDGHSPDREEGVRKSMQHHPDSRR